MTIVNTLHKLIRLSDTVKKSPKFTPLGISFFIKHFSSTENYTYI